MMIWSPVWLWPRARGPGAGLSFAAVVCSEPGWLRATPPLTAHPPPHQRITRPLIPCEQRVQAFPLSLRHQLGLGQQSTADPPPDLGLRGFPVRPDVGDPVPHGLCPRMGHPPERGGGAARHPRIADLPVGHAHTRDRPVPVPHPRPHPAQPASLLHQLAVLPHVEITRIRDTSDLHPAPPPFPRITGNTAQV